MARRPTTPKPPRALKRRRESSAAEGSPAEARAGTLPYSVPSNPAVAIDNTQSHAVASPVFAQPTATVDPTEFTVRHGSDTQA